MIMRFDDTNPANEKEEFKKSILADLETLGIKPDMYTNTSDHFDLILQKAEDFIKEGLAYCDKSTGDEIKE